MSDLGKLISDMELKHITCPKCGRTLQRSISTMSEFVCPGPNCKYKFDALVQGDFVMYYNPNDGKSKELASVLIDRFSSIMG